MADGATGHVLTIEGEVYLSDGKPTYLVFDTLDAARLFIKDKQTEDETVECYINDSNYKLLERWDAMKWKH